MMLSHEVFRYARDTSSFAFDILKANPTGTLSQDRYRAALAGIDRLIDLVNPER